MKEFIEAYQDNIVGIYCIIHNATGRAYVGSSENIRKRGMQHFQSLNNNNHHNVFLQRAWNKHSSTCFSFLSIESCVKDKLIERENFYIDVFRNCSKSFNMTSAGKVFDWSGRKHTEATKKKMSASAILTRKRKLTQSQVLEIRELVASGRAFPDLAEHFGVSTSTIWKIVHRKKWAHL